MTIFAMIIYIFLDKKAGHIVWLCLVLIQPRKTGKCPNITENFWLEFKASTQPSELTNLKQILVGSLRLKIFMIKKHYIKIRTFKSLLLQKFLTAVSIFACLGTLNVSLFWPDNVVFNLSVCIFLALKSSLYFTPFSPSWQTLVMWVGASSVCHSSTTVCIPYLLTWAQGSKWGISMVMGWRLSGVVHSRFKTYFSNVRWPFHVNHHQVGGKATLGVWAD